VVRLKQSSRKLNLLGKEEEALDVVFVSCAVCVSTLSNVYDPFTAKYPRFLDPDKYAYVLRSLLYLFGCTPMILTQKKFSLTALRIKQMAMVRDPREIFHMPAVPEENLMIILDGYEVRKDCRFFRHEPLIKDREIPRCVPSTFAEVVTRAPVYQHRPTHMISSRLCLADPPPVYTSNCDGSHEIFEFRHGESMILPCVQ
jgi:hypothetical protein